jgi:hypothetical protein
MDGAAIGTVTTFTGKAAFPFGYVLADGTTYAQGTYPQGYTFAVAEVAAGNALWTVDTTNKLFTVPDLRDRFLLSSAALGWATKAGESTHALTWDESGTNGNGMTNNDSPDHSHSGTTNAADRSLDHLHVAPSGSTVFVTAGGSATGQGVASSAGQTIKTPSTTGAMDRSIDHLHSFGTGGRSVYHQHALVSRGADTAHNNMPPYCVLAMIVKVAGITVDPATAIVRGPAGARGSTTYLYNGVGIPAAGTFVGELDGDWAIRKTDGEMFQRVSGAWVDQAYTNRSTAPITSARAYRAAALSVPAATWTKVPLDTQTYDSSANLFNVANGRFVAPTAGTYQVSGAICYGLSATGTYTYLIAGIWKNGATWSDPQYCPAVQNYGSVPIADTVPMNAGDYIELYAYINFQTATIVTGPLQTFMSVVLITAGPGPQGQRGSNWYTYTGAGTPAVGTFLNELDRDMAVRASDGEVFTRISGAWVDQNWKTTAGMQTMDTWHTVGNSGEPAFQNSWTHYGAPFPQAGFRKFPDGKVKLRGLVKGGAVGTYVFTLPVGYRPPTQPIFACDSNSGIHARVDVYSTGEVLVSATSTGAPGYLSLANIEFDTESITNMASGPVGPQGPAGMGQALTPILQTTASRQSNPFELVIPQNTGFTVILPPNPANGTMVGIQGGQMIVQASTGDLIYRDGVSSGAGGSLTTPTNAFGPTLVLIFYSAGRTWNVFSDTRPGGTILGIQRNIGKAVAYNQITASGPIGDGTVGPLTISVTPTIPCFWEVNFMCANVVKIDANYHYAQLTMTLNLGDQDGIGAGGAAICGPVISQHSAVQTYEGRTFQRIFRLAAGTAYTITPGFSISGGTWQYYTAPTHLWIEGKLWAQ